ncbi:riboflavin biosynthesis protein RibF [Lentilactobacillus sp. Marseille-Q4993]|uniref:riboflavin biosynthesis protein RibF n=1 Tax=Lentilactobacillus sp. Marseille-Q4993 TaxID=3039492 RepID=UPI0024BC9186|nr:riboflavin biosynthesis protein RibF [Lentilactobacillus sp. Marseille-Q4993]
MEIVRLHYPLSDEITSNEDTVLAMGFFDGFHRGHQAVLEKAKQRAKELGAKFCVLTYNHHPALVYKKLSSHEKRYITLLKDKLALLEKFGVDRVYLVDYTFQFQNQNEVEFVDNFIKRFRAKAVVAGFDHTYGSDPKKANMENLSKFSDGSFEVISVDPINFEGKKVSSTRIRRALDDADVATVNQLLGRPFKTHGVIVHGREVGRLLGYPTANIEHNEMQWLPAIGIYIVAVSYDGKKHLGMASIGRNVTFEDSTAITVEINILDFNENIYGETLTVEWLEHIRDEVKFQTPQDLTTQLYDDEVVTREYLKKHPDILN